MSSKKNFGSSDELNLRELSKLSFFSQCPPPMPLRSRRLSHDLLSKIPSSLRRSQSISSTSADFAPFLPTEPFAVYVQDKNGTPSEDSSSSTSTIKKQSSKNVPNDQTKKPIESRNSRSSKFRNSTLSSDPKQSDLPPIKEETKDEYDHELYHTSPRVFKPRLYNFKNPLYNLNNFEKSSFKVLAPPFWVLVDHMIAVVWFLYSGDKKEKVEVGHLQWALEFAKWMRDAKGDHSKIVRNLITVFQDAISDKKGEDNDGTPDNTQSQENARTMYSKEDEMTSVTLQDILSRTSGLPPDKVCGPCSVGGPVYESSAKESPPAPPTTPAQPERLKNAEDDVDDHERLLKFLEQIRESQNDKVNKESNRLKELDEAIEALKEGKLKFDEWLKQHIK